MRPVWRAKGVRRRAAGRARRTRARIFCAAADLGCCREFWLQCLGGGVCEMYRVCPCCLVGVFLLQSGCRRVCIRSKTREIKTAHSFFTPTPTNPFTLLARLRLRPILMRRESVGWIWYGFQHAFNLAELRPTRTKKHSSNTLGDHRRYTHSATSMSC